MCLQDFRVQDIDVLWLGSVLDVNIFVVAVSVNKRGSGDAQVKVGVHAMSTWVVGRDSICLYARHQVQRELLGGGEINNGHTEYISSGGVSRWNSRHEIVQVRVQSER